MKCTFCLSVARTLIVQYRRHGQPHNYTCIYKVFYQSTANVYNYDNKIFVKKTTTLHVKFLIRPHWHTNIVLKIKKKAFQLDVYRPLGRLHVAPGGGGSWIEQVSHDVTSGEQVWRPAGQGSKVWCPTGGGSKSGVPVQLGLTRTSETITFPQLCWRAVKACTNISILNWHST